MYPVIIGGSLQWFAGYKRPTLFLLPETILVLGSVDKLLLQALLFAITIGPLLVCNLRLFVELLLGILLWAENTLVCLPMVSTGSTMLRMLLT